MTLLREPWPENRALAKTYDAECAGRRDHDFYLDLALELGAGAIVDIGCGTGVFAVDAASRGLQAIGVDPAGAVQQMKISATVQWYLDLLGMGKKR